MTSPFKKYRGITYPQFLIYFRWQEWLWKKIFCKRDMHLFDEVASDRHYLVCDVCQLLVVIDEIETKYMET